MIKKLLLSTLCFFSVMHADNLYEPYNYALVINNCSNFIQQPSAIKSALYLATLTAGFKNTTITEHECYDIVFGYRAVGDKGYASLFACELTSTCIIEFFCEDESYDYDTFFNTFRKLISLYDLKAMLTSTSNG